MMSVHVRGRKLFESRHRRVTFAAADGSNLRGDPVNRVNRAYPLTFLNCRTEIFAGFLEPYSENFDVRNMTLWLGHYVKIIAKMFKLVVRD